MSVMTIEAYKQSSDLRRRIALSNRVRLSVGPAKLEAVTATLAASRGERARFIENPTAYLKANALPVSSCNLGTAPGRSGKTLEVIVSDVAASMSFVMDSSCGVLLCLAAVNRVFISAFGYQ